MGLFRRNKPAPLVVSEPEERSTIDAIAAMARNSSASYTFSGANVTLDSALRSAAAWACITRLKATISALPVDVVRNQAGKRTVLDKAAQPMLIRSPSGVVSRRGWVGQVVHSLTTAGNAYGDVLDVDGMGRPTLIETVSSSRVSWSPTLGFLVDGKQRLTWPRGDLWHIAASHLLRDGEHVAMSPIAYGRDAISTGLAAEKYGGDFFRAGAAPVGILEPTGTTAPTIEQAQMAKDAILRATENRGVAALVSWKLTPYNINPADTQFIDLLQYTVLEASRRWLVPPSMIYAAMSGQNVTYANVTDADLQYWKHSVANWVVDLEDSWADMIPGQLVAKFNVDAVLRMDKKARSEEHKLRLETKTRTINEVRRLEDEDPFDDPIYDEPGIPMPAAPPAVPAAP